MTEEKAAKIKLVFLDVDGVMTDGRITMDAQGKETKSFCVKDGLGLRMLTSGGVDVVIVTGRSSQAVEHRANDLGIKEVHQGVTDKSLLCRQIIKDRGFTKQEICCIGDDLADLPMFSEAGLCIAVADAVKEVREAADFITRSKGGFGAVREACEWLLKSQGKWQAALAPFAGE